MSEQPFMKFEIREKVQHFKDERTFNELENLELQPIVKVHQSDQRIEITGYLTLNGEFAISNEDTEWEEQFEQSDAIHYGAFFAKEPEIETFQYQIPISIQLPTERVQDPEQLFVLVDSFDYELLSSEEIELTAYIKLLGVHPEPKQEKPVDGFDDLDQAEEYEVVAFVDKAEDKEQQETNQEVEVISQTDVESKQTIESEVETVDNQVEETEAETETEAEAEAEESEQLEAAEVIEQEIEEEPIAKMKIGIQGKSRPKRAGQESNSTSLLYSLLGGKKEKQQEEVTTQSESEEAEITKEVTIEESEVTENIVEEAVNEVDEVSEDVESTEATEVVQATDKSAKDMLYSLLSGDEERKYTLKMYFVQREDTLETIAEKYQLQVNEIILYNQLQGQEISAGQIIYLPTNR